MFRASSVHLQEALQKQLTPKTAGEVPPEDGGLTPETCRLRNKKVIVKVNVKVY
jgi:hypothetical protein